MQYTAAEMITKDISIILTSEESSSSMKGTVVQLQRSPYPVLLTSGFETSVVNVLELDKGRGSYGDGGTDILV